MTTDGFTARCANTQVDIFTYSYTYTQVNLELCIVGKLAL